MSSSGGGREAERRVQEALQRLYSIDPEDFLAVLDELERRVAEKLSLKKNQRSA